MSAAEPANPDHPYPNAPGQAHVIDLTRRRSRGTTHTLPGRWKRMDAPPPGQPGPGHNPSPLELVVEDMEKWLYACGHTLTDADTVTVVIRTLEMTDHIVLAGAEARGIIDSRQRAELSELLAGLKLAAEHMQQA